MKKIIWLVVVMLVVGAGVYFLKNKNSSPTSSEPDNSSSVSKQTPESATATPESTSTPLSSSNSIQISTKAVISTPTTKTIDIKDFSFSQTSLTINKGDTVVWTNKDSAPHTVTGDNGGPSSGTLNQNQTYSFTFNSIGTFSYHCNFHPSMKGSVVVK